MSASAVSALGAVAKALVPAPVMALGESVKVANGVISRTALPKSAFAALPLGATGLQGAGQAPNVQTITMAKATQLGYDQSGSTGPVADVDPSDSLHPKTITVTVNLVKGMQYDIDHVFAYRYPKAKPAITLTAQGPTSKAISLNAAKPSFKATESGSYTLTWSINNNAWFDGAFQATVKGKATLPASSGNATIDALLQRQDAWWHDPGQVPTTGTTEVMPGVKALAAGSSKSVVTYSFMTSQSAPADVLKANFPKEGQDKHFAALSQAQKTAALAAFKFVSDVTNLTFQEDATGAGNIQLGAYDMSAGNGGIAGLDGISNLPNQSPSKDKVYTFVNAAVPGDLGDSSSGSYGWNVMWHEIGHALGLKHPGNYDASGKGGTAPYLPAATDNHQNSIMSYKDNSYSKTANVQSYMAYDVAALQYLYGVNTSGSTAVNQAFTFDGSKAILKTLYSATGNDKIDLTGLSNGSVVNLNAGTMSSINQLRPDNPKVNTSYSGNQNVALAYGSKVQNVTLSTANANDTVILNAAFKSSAFDVVQNLQAGDKFGLSAALFGKLAANNIAIATNHTATSKDSKILVDTSTKSIYYDADGSGTKSAAVKIAQYDAVAGMTIQSSNFSFLT